MTKKDLLSFRETFISGVLMLFGYFLDKPILLILAIIIGGYQQTKEGLIDTFENKHLNVELLMILSAMGASLIGYYMEGAVLIFIFSLSGALEELTLDRSKREIRSLMELQPTEATVLLENGETKTVDVNDLKIGDSVIVAVGETIPIDGMITQGKSSIEEAAITGESLPVEKASGDSVFGGTLNVSHPLTIKVNSDVSETLIQKIVKMVDDAQNYPSKTARFIDNLEDQYARVVLIVVALVIIIPIAFMGHTFEQAFYRGMILLVVASPCALIASVTPATLSAISNGAKRGILVKGGVHFENMMDAKAVAFDKTGTLTQGIPSLTDYYFTLDNEEEIANAIIGIEQYSTHPLANAIISGLLKTFSLENRPNASDIEEKAGFGVAGSYHDVHYKIGKLEYMDDQDEKIVAKAREWAHEGKSIVYIQQSNKMIGVLALIDEVREDSKHVVNWLNNNGIATIMITGDNDETAKNIGEKIGVQRIISQALPDEKANIIRELEEEFDTVIMIGDGINDAPALANASIGVAMGSGTDIAMEAADVILVQDDISSIQYAIQLSQRLRKIVIQNITFSFAVILFLVFANFFDKINLPIGVVGHEGSTILVILNSLRLLKPIKKD